MGERSRMMTVVLWILQVLMAAVFVMAGGAKLAGQPAMVEMYDTIGFGKWFRTHHSVDRDRFDCVVEASAASGHVRVDFDALRAAWRTRRAAARALRPSDIIHSPRTYP